MSNRRIDLYVSFLAATAIHGALILWWQSAAATAGNVDFLPAFQIGRSAIELSVITRNVPAPEEKRIDEKPAVLVQPDNGEPLPAPEPDKNPPSVKTEPEHSEEPAGNRAADTAEKEANTDPGVDGHVYPGPNMRPEYPRGSRLRGEQGTVRIRVNVDATGRALDVAILESSGYAQLDNAAVKDARKTSYVPAVRKGKPAGGIIVLSFEFRLEQ